MNLTQKVVVAVAAVCVFATWSTPEHVKHPLPYRVPVVVPHSLPAPITHGGLVNFLHRMSGVESGHNPAAVSSHGMLGKYQFHPATIRSLGFRTTPSAFLQNVRLQDSVMVAYMRANKRELRAVLTQFVGTTYRGVYITESGVLAGAHLGGTIGVLSFFYPDRFHAKTVDANGTTIKLYMKKFAGYNLSGM